MQGLQWLTKSFRRAEVTGANRAFKNDSPSPSQNPAIKELLSLHTIRKFLAPEPCYHNHSQKPSLLVPAE